MSKYSIYLSFNNQEEGFELPIIPRQIEMSEGLNGAKYDITKLGEINVIKARKLTQYKFEGLLPAQNYPFVTTDFLLEPKTYVDYILKWMDSKRPIRFIFVGSTFDINEAVSIENFVWKEVAGSVGDIEYSLTLQKYVFYVARNVRVASDQQQQQQPVIEKEPPKREDDRVPPKTYTLRAGDNLWKIAQSILGNGARCREIQQLNGISDAETKRLAIGRVLKLPNA